MGQSIDFHYYLIYRVYCCYLLIRTIMQNRANWSATPQYYIDFARGSVVHSSAASNGQTNRLFKGYDVAGSLKHLTYVQITDFYKKNKTAEFYLMYLKTLALNEINRGALQASPSYIKVHQRFFDKAYNTLEYPISQNSNVGFVRSHLDRQKLVDFMTKLSQQALHFGQVQVTSECKEQRKNIILNSLREIAFAKKEE